MNRLDLKILPRHLLPPALAPSTSSSLLFLLAESAGFLAARLKSRKRQRGGKQTEEDKNFFGRSSREVVDRSKD